MKEIEGGGSQAHTKPSEGEKLREGATCEKRSGQLANGLRRGVADGSGTVAVEGVMPASQRRSGLRRRPPWRRELSAAWLGWRFSSQQTVRRSRLEGSPATLKTGDSSSSESRLAVAVFAFPQRLASSFDPRGDVATRGEGEEKGGKKEMGGSSFVNSMDIQCTYLVFWKERIQKRHVYPWKMENGTVWMAW